MKKDNYFENTDNLAEEGTKGRKSNIVNKVPVSHSPAKAPIATHEIL